MGRQKSAIAGLVVALTAGAAMAAPVVRLNDSEGNGNQSDGFRIDLGADGSYEYITFCVETAETFSLGHVYEYTVSTEIRNAGGIGPINFDDARGHALAYIFSTYHADGGAGIQALSGIALGSDTEYRELVQRTIWNKLYGGHTTGSFTIGMINQLYNAAFGDTTDLGNVRVLNMWDDAETGFGPHQDMLVIVPLPTGAGLASAGLLGLAATARRRRA